MRPEALHIELLHACPLRCLACDHRLLGPARLRPADLRRVLAMPQLAALKLVSFSGGEPLLHPGLRGFLLKAAGAWPDARLVLLTGLYDGAALLRLLRSLPPAVLARLHVGTSLDGPARVHDRMRGRRGAFAALERGWRALRREFPAVSAGFTFTATAANAACFSGAVRAARRLGGPLGVQFLVPNAVTAGLELGPARARALAAGLRDALAAGRSDNLAAALAFLAGKGRRGPCGAGRTFLMLSPEGRFYLCPFHKELSSPPEGAAALRRRLKGPALRACERCFLRCAR